jgi:transcriptional regulator of met regulon
MTEEYRRNFYATKKVRNVITFFDVFHFLYFSKVKTKIESFREQNYFKHSSVVNAILLCEAFFFEFRHQLLDVGD